ncbi:TPA: hypothetical protein DEP34_00470 [Candidatus Uhrbacteria bacterium]|uniref:DUF5673 domain-containing protein n=2 Tax=Candidatus Uhriibacteriota TaxID=1752732 RepID=A0A0G1Q8T5_9BACT|nr:MAG: hypothetical protein UX45_C0003G0056 [Candidatus Uhrbacteria bacterium GW2011_GWF2_46_218]KKU41227.1 MAG: hypothetical protein UX57_C0005G0057 [Candidatus Uhrbacteria bacterium GW2011_GWE2_46_68]HBK34076.1 hypothetical protein [Candidatus Uhrbacteria bacterium]HCB18846.1 hypothetical protein [Candidatus Uhrbacteria bacterium]
MEPTTTFRAHSYGDTLLHWEIDEYPRHTRSRLWFILVIGVGTALLLYAFLTANLTFAVVLLMIGIIMLISVVKEPSRLDIIITNTGLIVGDTYYDYPAIKDFSVVYDPPDVKYLYVDFRSTWQPLVSIPLEDVDPNQVRAHLLPYCAENLERMEEGLTDVLRRMYKL